MRTPATMTPKAGNPLAAAIVSDLRAMEARGYQPECSQSMGWEPLHRDYSWHHAAEGEFFSIWLSHPDRPDQAVELEWSQAARVTVYYKAVEDGPGMSYWQPVHTIVDD